MQTSDYLVRALFHQLNNGTDQFLEIKSETLFQRPGSKSFIEVHHQQQLGQQGPPSQTLFLDDKQEPRYCSVPSSLLEGSRCCSLNQDLQPTYDNSLGLLRQDILDLKVLQQIEKVSALWRH